MAIGLNNLKAPPGATHKKKRVGAARVRGWARPPGAATRVRSHAPGYSGDARFEGGQMPLHRRLPKRGFTNIFKREWAEVNLADLEQVFEAGAERDARAARRARPDPQIEARSRSSSLGRASSKKALTVIAHRFSASAKQKIEAAGGKAEVLGAGTGRRVRVSISLAKGRE